MLTVEENLRLALVQAGIQDEKSELDKAYAMFPVLKEKSKDRGRTLSGGQLQMLANARALLGPARLILMDEPTEGLAPIIIEQIRKSILEINRAEGRFAGRQHLQMALSVGDRHYIINPGIVFRDLRPTSGPTKRFRPLTGGFQGRITAGGNDDELEDQRLYLGDMAV
jgi:branched-chain amino acid transport system ATP-binding protein